jgi:hypothetical protein
MPNASGRGSRRPDADDLRPQYHFSRATRSRYAGRCAAGTSVVLLAPDVAALFPDLDAVNDASRAYPTTVRWAPLCDQALLS